MSESEGIIWTNPVNFRSTSSLTKMALDRTYALEKGEIKQNTSTINTVKEMVHQMISLIHANLKFPEEFDVPMLRLVRRKYHLWRGKLIFVRHINSE